MGTRPEQVREPEPRIAVLISGGGRTLKNLVRAIEQGCLGASISVVVGSRECAGIEWAKERGLTTRVLPGHLSANALRTLAKEFCVDWFVLAGYLKRVEIPSELQGRFVNIHPALLPKYGGAGMYGLHVHSAVLAAKEDRSGCTVHLCDAEYDRGPVLAQATCSVEPDDTPESLAAKVFELECDVYPRTLQKLFEGTIQNPLLQGAKSISR